MLLEPREIATSRSTTATKAIAAFTLDIALALFMPDEHRAHPGFWLIIGVLFLAAAGGGLLGWRPARLILDREGFYILGPIRRVSAKDRKVFWRDVESFTLMAVPGLKGKTRQYVTFRFKPGTYQPARGIAAMNRLLNPLLNPDEKYYVPMIWPRSEAAIVDELNDYRLRALS